MPLLLTMSFFSIFILFMLCYITIYSLWSVIEFLFNRTIAKLF